jgi:hypothetical protein
MSDSWQTIVVIGCYAVIAFRGQPWGGAEKRGLDHALPPDCYELT